MTAVGERRREIVRLEVVVAKFRAGGYDESTAATLRGFGMAATERELERLRRLERWQRIDVRR